MTESTPIALAPVSGKARIDVLDMLRGIAILGIFFMNVPFMALEMSKLFVDVRLIGWTPADRASWYAVQLLLEGTQRGLLELLFGAGMMVLTARAMTPDGPVAIADLHIRRNLWLLGFGLFDVFVLLWAGDILHIYALAALFLFPFRKLGPRLLLALGLANAAYLLVSGVLQYSDRADLMHRAEIAHQKQAAHVALAPADTEALDQLKKVIERRRGGDEIKQIRKMEAEGHAGGVIAYARMNIGVFLTFVYPSLLANVIEAFTTMLIGIALWKWRVIQGGRTLRFYLVLMLACYVPAVAARLIGAGDWLSMEVTPKASWMTQEAARIAMSIGHVALVNLAVRSGAGRALLAPFKAAGRMAFSLYFMQQIIGLWILFAPWGPNLWAKFHWAQLFGVALIVLAAQLVFANMWLRLFAAGPLEWLWRSLAYVRWQPFLRRDAETPAPQVP
ncbi:MAG: DUF418 domain-containing protein [Sphingomonas sp.]